MPTPPSDTYLSVRDLAKRWKVGIDQVLHLIASGKLIAIDMRNEGSKRPRWRISPAAVAAYEKPRASKAPAPKGPRRRKSTAKERY